MRIAPSSRRKQRRLLDRLAAALRPFADMPNPAAGWVRTVRESLGLTAAQLAGRLGVKAATLIDMEKRERSGRVTLEVLERAARAMGGRLVYGIVPAEARSFEEMVDAQALRTARRLARRTADSMALEQQEVREDETDAQVQELAQALKEKMSSAIWDD